MTNTITVSNDVEWYFLDLKNKELTMQAAYEDQGVFMREI